MSHRDPGIGASCGSRQAASARRSCRGTAATRVLLLALSVLGIALHAAAASPAPPAAGNDTDEYQVKAAFLYNFAKFVQWPAEEGPLTLCLIGEDPLSGHLQQAVNGRSVSGREVVVKRLSASDDVLQCRVLFIGASEARRTPEVLKLTAVAPILTVGETPPFLREGGIVRFFVEGNRMRFQINSARATRAGLKISSQLLSLAAR